MKYIGKMRIWGRFEVEIEAENPEEAEKKLDLAWQEADFGDATEIDSKTLAIEEVSA